MTVFFSCIFFGGIFSVSKIPVNKIEPMVVNNYDSLKNKCFGGDDNACLAISKIINDSCAKINDNQYDEKIKCDKFSRLYQNLGIMIWQSNKAASDFGKNSLEYLDSRKPIYNFLKETDSCRKLPSGISFPTQN